ncbi:PrsW family intramembrane metalloprotease [Oculatella sp. LEGE 06141]|uniref:PrsW family glutamic-type intramembrane protease n=1 Tax=Oculatella sp. LEGE 06141 TaxID=1828648 RepID=UPI00187E7EDD|nr:PrsW family glutamic-type intramembrane protease [Oculatella sp. LEGE 06141]MBE9181071.1 PrsW family intramembrane metalloprotease [Oculatella sp. LEGE 06141]
MTGSLPRIAFLRQVPLNDAVQPTLPPYRLTTQTEVLIGRDPCCHILLDSDTYGRVSRQHAKVCPIPTSVLGWQVCDLNSSNGTYVNGRRLQGCRSLQSGDRIMLAQDGPQFVFEWQSSTPYAVSEAPYAASSVNPRSTDYSQSFNQSRSADDITLSQLFPILSTGRDLTRKAYLVPAIFTVAFVVSMFFAVGNTIFFNVLLATYIAGAAYYFVYQLCGKRKPWWILVSAALVSVLVLTSPLLNVFLFVFRDLLPGAVPQKQVDVSFPVLLMQMFFGAGLMEELLKALPVLLAYGIGTLLRSPYREIIGVWEPLDGILLGTASAVGFTLLETLGQYVPSIVSDTTLQAGEGAGELAGLQLLIPRILGSIAGHMAYSGYLGYFIGLSVLKPAKRWRILGIGYLTSASLHALWNATGILSFLVLAVVGVLSYAFLAAAILKARALSPTRSQNFATRFSRLS